MPPKEDIMDKVTRDHFDSVIINRAIVEENKRQINERSIKIEMGFSGLQELFDSAEEKVSFPSDVKQVVNQMVTWQQEIVELAKQKEEAHERLNRSLDWFYLKNRGQ